MSGYAGFKTQSDIASDFSAQSFLIEQIVNRLATTAVVKVVGVTAVGQVAPVGFVDVVVMVNQVDGDGNPTPHATINNMPYFRLQGGANAVIIDPAVGDLGIAVFCSRDISGVKRTRAVANPGSTRKYDWADGLYIGGILNGVPTQFIQFSASGIAITSPTQITLTAPTITMTGNIGTTGTMTSNGHDISSTHRHTASGGSGTGGPPV